MNHQSSRTRMLPSMAAGISLLLCFAAFQAQAVVPYSHVISNTTTSMIDTVYNAQGQIVQINTFVGVAPSRYVYSAAGAPSQASGVSWPGGYQIDTSSVPARLTLNANKEIQGSDHTVIGTIQLPPDVPNPNYNGLASVGYIVYNPNTGMPANTVYVIFTYTNGSVTGISTQTAPPPGPPSGGGKCIPGSDQRPCKQPDAMGSARH